MPFYILYRYRIYIDIDKHRKKKLRKYKNKIKKILPHVKH